MRHLTDEWIVPWLALLGDWSVRWGVVLVVLAVWLALRPPKRAATRYVLCLATLVAGLVLPLAPRWGQATLPWPAWGTVTTHRTNADVDASSVCDDSTTGFTDLSNSAGSLPRHFASTADSEMNRARPLIVPPTTMPRDPWRIAALATASVWAVIVMALLARLAGGWLMLRQLVDGAMHVGSRSDRLVDDCRRALELSRPVALAAHPTVVSPVVVGGPRPIVLVPSDWNDWTELRRRACLLHELAHLARHDDWAKLVQELIRAFFFFHPLVHWLLNRLDRERELLCDETTVALGADPIAFARLLLDLGRRSGRLISFASSHPTGCLPFFDRRTVAVRIERLLEEDMVHTVSRSSGYRSVLLGGLAVAVALVVGGLRVRAVAAEPADPQKQTTAAAEPPKRTETSAAQNRPGPVAVPELPKEVGSVVLDSDGRPVAGATILVGATGSGRPGHQVITTNAQGRFGWLSPPGPRHAYLVAHKDGLAAATRLISADTPAELLDESKIILGKSASFSAVIVDGEGKPIAGAELRIEMIARRSEQKYDGGATVTTSYDQIRRDVVANSTLESHFVTMTDAGGRFAFRAIRTGSALKLRVTAANGRALVARSTTVAAGRFRISMEDEGFVTVTPDETVRLVAVPAARVAGRVVTKLPGVKVSGLTAFFQDSRQPGIYRPITNFGTEVQTDSEGRFTFDGLNEGTINIVVQGEGENKDWSYRAAKDVKLTLGVTSEVTIELIRGVQVEGTVIAQGTRAPVEGAQVGVHGPVRPRTSAMVLGAITDARGRFRCRLPSGESYFYVMAPPRGFMRTPGDALSGDGSNHTVTIPDEATRFEVPPLEVSAFSVRGRVLNAAGAPVVGAKVLGVREGPIFRLLETGETLTDARGEFVMPTGFYNPVAVGKPARFVIRLRGGAKREVAVFPAEDGVVTVKLTVADEDVK